MGVGSFTVPRCRGMFGILIFLTARSAWLGVLCVCLCVTHRLIVQSRKTAGNIYDVWLTVAIRFWRRHIFSKMNKRGIGIQMSVFGHIFVYCMVQILTCVHMEDCDINILTFHLLAWTRFALSLIWFLCRLSLGCFFLFVEDHFVPFLLIADVVRWRGDFNFRS